MGGLAATAKRGLAKGADWLTSLTGDGKRRPGSWNRAVYKNAMRILYPNCDFNTLEQGGVRIRDED